MTTQTMNLSALSAWLTSDGVVDPVLTDALANLPTDFNNLVQVSQYSVDGLESPNVRALILGVDGQSPEIDTVNTSATHIKDIFALNGTQLTLEGSNNVYVGTDTSEGVSVVDQGSGNNVIEIDSTQGSATGGTGHDTLISDSSNVTLTAGTGQHQLLVDNGPGGSSLNLSASYQTAMDSASTSGDTLSDAAGFSHQHLIVNGSNDLALAHSSGTFVDLVGSNNTALILDGSGQTITSEGINNFLNIKGGGGLQHVVDTGGGLMIQDSMAANLDVSGIASNMATLNLNNALFAASNIIGETALASGGEAIKFSDGLGDVATLALTNVIANLSDGTQLTIDGGSPKWAVADAAHEVSLVGHIEAHLTAALHHA